jgi:hypothetical protein
VLVSSKAISDERHLLCSTLSARQLSSRFNIISCCRTLFWFLLVALGFDIVTEDVRSAKDKKGGAESRHMQRFH